MRGASDVNQRPVVETDTWLNDDVGELRSGEIALLESDVAELGELKISLGEIALSEDHVLNFA